MVHLIDHEQGGAAADLGEVQFGGKRIGSIQDLALTDTNQAEITNRVQDEVAQLHEGTTEDFIAISTRCMHLGCPVRYVEASKKFICPCHGGVYDFDGGVSGGPPVRPLDRFYVRVRDGQVQVGPRYSVNSEFRRFPSYRDPGQTLDGIGQYMYPGRFSTPKLD